MVIVKDIDIFSYCEHHMALMYDMKVSVAYLPKDKVLGPVSYTHLDVYKRQV